MMAIGANDIPRRVETLDGRRALFEINWRIRTETTARKR